MRVLACSIGTPGLLYPVLGIARELQSRGHDVRVVTDRRLAGPVTEAGLVRIPWGRTDHPSFAISRWPLPESVVTQAAHVAAALAEHPADVVLGSELALGPLLAAERAGLPAVVVGLLGYLWPADEARRRWPADYCGRHQSGVWERVIGVYAEARARLGLRPRPYRCDAGNPLLGTEFLLRNRPELTPDADRLPDRVRFVGPCRWEPAGDDAADLAWLARQHRPVVYAQLARNADRSSLLPWLREATAGGEAAVVVELGRWDGPVPTDLPDHVRVVHAGRHDHLLRAADAVIGHGTTTATLGGLCHGLPALLAPTGGEQPVVARICRRAGVAVELDPTAAPADQLRRLRTDPDLHARAAAVRDVLGPDDPAGAADLIGDLLAGTDREGRAS